MNDPNQPEDDSNWDDLARDFGLEPDEESPQAEPAAESEAPPESDEPTEEPTDDEPVPIAIIFDEDGEPQSVDEEPEAAELIAPEPDGPEEPIHGATREPRELDPEAQALFDTIFVPNEDGRILRFPSKAGAWPSDEPTTGDASADEVFEPNESDEDEIAPAPVVEKAKRDDDDGDGEKKKRRRRRRKKKEDDRSESDSEPSAPRVREEQEPQSANLDAVDTPFDEDDEEDAGLPTVGDWNLPTWDELIASLNRN